VCVRGREGGRDGGPLSSLGPQPWCCSLPYSGVVSRGQGLGSVPAAAAPTACFGGAGTDPARVDVFDAEVVSELLVVLARVYLEVRQVLGLALLCDTGLRASLGRFCPPSPVPCTPLPPNQSHPALPHSFLYQPLVYRVLYHISWSPSPKPPPPAHTLPDCGRCVQVALRGGSQQGEPVPLTVALDSTGDLDSGGGGGDGCAQWLGVGGAGWHCETTAALFDGRLSTQVCRCRCCSAVGACPCTCG
jgi:hypothetical protein